jgi:hypothetical protein
VIPLVWGKIAAFAAEKQRARGLLAALRFEISANIDLLDAVKPEALKTASITDSAFRALTESLRSEVAVSILFSRNRANYRRFRGLLKKLDSRGARFPADGEDGEDAPPTDGVFSALSYTVRKIETLKALARLAADGAPLFRDLNLALRVSRLRKNLGELRSMLHRI